VRIVITERHTGYFNKRYIEIKKIFGTHLVGSVNDPYNGIAKCKCNICLEDIDTNFYSCGGELYNRCNYHICNKCYFLTGTSKHSHEVKKYIHPFADGALITFKKTSIMEIPNWTSNAEKIIRKYGKHT
jgi:hypothetical protein